MRTTEVVDQVVWQVVDEKEEEGVINKMGQIVLLVAKYMTIFHLYFCTPMVVDIEDLYKSKKSVFIAPQNVQRSHCTYKTILAIDEYQTMSLKWLCLKCPVPI